MNDDLELMEELVEGSELTQEDVDEISASIDRRATEQAMRELDADDGFWDTKTYAGEEMSTADIDDVLYGSREEDGEE